MMALAKGLTNAAVPMGAVACRNEIYDAFMENSPAGIELFHGYTYSGHPLAAAAGLATLDIYKDEGLFERGQELAGYWEDAMHSFNGLPHVIDVRNLGIIGGIELEPIDGEPTKRAVDCFLDCYENGLLIRTTGDIIALSPPLILETAHIDRIADTLSTAIKRVN